MLNRTLVIAGIMALGIAWIWPVPQLAQQAFFGHMIMHMLNVAVAAPLLSLAIAGSRFDPVDRCPWLFVAIPASVVELIIVWGWHAPVPHHVARMHPAGLAAEQLMFLISGLWVWLSAVGGTSDVTRRGRRGTGVIGLLLTSMHMTLLGALLGLSPRSLYPHHDGFGLLSSVADQHLGGAIMLVVGGVAYLAGGLWLTLEVLSPCAVDGQRP
ncbi:MAG: cytochrome c oxidase assembly protein [Planctomycetaceae bacterium]